MLSSFLRVLRVSVVNDPSYPSHSAVTALTAFAPELRCNTNAMQSEKDKTLCPLCHGHGHERKELLVVRWRGREFEQALQKIADEAAFGSTSGLEEPFEMKEPVYSNESD